MPLDSSQQILQASLQVPPVPGGANCWKSFADIATWLKNSVVNFNFGQLFGYTSGTATSAPVDSRGMPRYLFDDSDRFVGVAVWVPSLGSWTIAGVIGEIKTIQRTAATIEQDMTNKSLAGWHLCNGTGTSVPDLTATLDSGEQKLIDPDNTLNTKIRFNAKVPNPFFAGTGPAWDRYSVMYLGTP